LAWKVRGPAGTIQEAEVELNPRENRAGTVFCWLYRPLLNVSAGRYLLGCVGPRLAVSAGCFCRGREPIRQASSSGREQQPKADTASIKQRPKAEQTPKAAAESRNNQQPAEPPIELTRAHEPAAPRRSHNARGTGFAHRVD